MPFDLSSMLGAFGRSMAYPQAQTPQTNQHMQNLPYYFGSGPTGQDALNAEPYYMNQYTDNPESYMRLLSTNGGEQSGMSTSNAPVSLLGPSVETPQTDMGVAGAGVGPASPYDYGSSSNAYPEQTMDPYGYQQQPSGEQGGRFGDFAGSFLYGMGAALASNRPGAGVPAMQEFAQRAERKKLIKQKEAQGQRAIEAGVKRLEALGRGDLASLVQAGTIDPGTALKMAMEPGERVTPYTDAGKAYEDYQRGFITKEQYDALAAGKQGGADGYFAPVQGYDDAGNPVLGMPGKDASFKVLDTPGFRPGGNIERVDGGTEWILYDRKSAQIVGRIPKDIAGAEEQKVIGTARGEAGVQLPVKSAAAQDVLKRADEILNHDALSRSVGAVDGWLPSITPGARDFDERVRQLRATAFLEARQMLKGGGAITDYEGQRGEDALLRASQAKSEEDFKAAIREFKDHVTRGFQILEEQAGGRASTPSASSGGAQRRRKYNPATGQIE